MALRTKYITRQIEAMRKIEERLTTLFPNHEFPSLPRKSRYGIDHRLAIVLEGLSNYLQEVEIPQVFENDPLQVVRDTISAIGVSSMNKERLVAICDALGLEVENTSSSEVPLKSDYERAIEDFVEGRQSAHLNEDVDNEDVEGADDGDFDNSTDDDTA